MNEFLYILFGWTLGLLSPIITEIIKYKLAEKEIKKAIRSELCDFQYKMASVVFLINQRYGKLSKDLLKWLLPIFKNYKGLYPNTGIVSVIEQLISEREEQLQLINEEGKKESEMGLLVKKYYLSYTESKIVELSIFSEKYQAAILDIVNNLKIFNEDVEYARFFFNKTYESGISPANYTRANEAVHNCYHHLRDEAKIIVERIESLKKIK